MSSRSSLYQRSWAWIFGLSLVVAGACTDEGAAYSTLQASGYKNIVLTGYSWLSCSKDDGTCTGFEAIGPGGTRVKGAVGCGFWSCSKGCTLRIEAVQ